MQTNITFFNIKQHGTTGNTGMIEACFNVLTFNSYENS